MKRFYVEEELVFAENSKSPSFQDLRGLSFGRLTILGYAGKINNSNGRYWFCKCDCGNIIATEGGRLKNGTAKSCGCLNIELTIERSTTHGHSRVGKVTLTYRTWAKIIERCLNPNSIGFSDYGGRGIKVCDRWLRFENFLDDMGERDRGKTIERIDNNGNYEKGNCRWATIREQANNKRNNRLLTFNGKTQTVSMWAEQVGLSYEVVLGRLNKRGWSVEKALTTPFIAKFSHPIKKHES
ncbi:MAG TPA: hypothetical protein PLL36_06750 [Candidatus Hydrogenedentes bacterium]|nr:hypothetical protein [Candidatus Hydrogenedentota bacterium]